ncbi:hypothetical protein NE237_009952 [Protea cynaroides]|uniref:Uncharacterized protein n=1 Tax=Protea cynaroides TaxID=273540 RepID=A0A9Q0KYR3_9MAGN|nr:hypothetical protein NE237_009952 [Protea cynaroides]
MAQFEKNGTDETDETGEFFRLRLKELQPTSLLGFGIATTVLQASREGFVLPVIADCLIVDAIVCWFLRHLVFLVIDCSNFNLGSEELKPQTPFLASQPLQLKKYGSSFSSHSSWIPNLRKLRRSVAEELNQTTCTNHDRKNREEPLRSESQIGVKACPDKTEENHGRRDEESAAFSVRFLLFHRRLEDCSRPTSWQSPD